MSLLRLLSSLAASAVSLGALASAQGVTLLDSYPYSESWSIASRPAAGSGPDLIVAGAGGGLLLFEHDSSSPCTAPPCTLAPPSGVTPDRYDTGGMAFGIALGPAHAYVGAFRHGLDVFDRGSSPWTRFDVAGTLGASEVAIADMGGNRTLIAAGTREDVGPAPGPSGRLLVLEHDRSLPLSLTNPRILYSESVGAPVHAVALSAALPQTVPIPLGTTGFAVFFGTACGVDASSLPAPLQRRDFGYAPGSLVLAASSAWGGEPSSAPWLTAGVYGRYVKDLALDEGTARLYAACYMHGVYAFDVSDGLVQDTRPGWPLHPPSNSQPSVTFVQCVAVDPGPLSVPGRLLVGLGGTVDNEQQFIGDCGGIDCNAEEVPPYTGTSTFTLAAYPLDSTGLPIPVGGAIQPEAQFADVAPAQDIAVRRSPAATALNDQYFVDAASGKKGARVYHFQTQPPAGTNPVIVSAQFGQGGLPPALPMNTYDDLTLKTNGSGSSLRYTLYAGTELGLAAFDVTSPGPGALLAGYSRFVPFTAIGLASISDGFPRVYASTFLGRVQSYGPCDLQPPWGGGIKAYDVSDRLNPKSALGPAAAKAQIHKGGYGYMLKLVQGLDASSPPDLRSHYVYSVQELRPWDATHPVQYSVRGWNVGSISQPFDEGDTCEPDANVPPFPNDCISQSPNCNCHASTTTDPVCIGSFLTDWPGPPAAVAQMQLEGIEVLEYAGSHVLYVGYAQEAPTNTFVPQPGPSGVLVLRTSGSGVQPSSIDYVTHLRIWTANETDSEHRPVRLNLDGNVLYAAWATGGIAAIDVSNPLQPQLIARRRIDGVTATGIRQAPVEVLPAPLGTTSGHPYLYVALVNDGIGLWELDPAAGTLTKKAVFPMRYQTFGLAYDPTDASRRTLYTVQARGGIDRVRFDPALFQ